MSFSLSNLLPTLQKGLELVQMLTPVATALGAPPELVEKATNIAGAVLDTAQNVQVRITEGTIVATSQDQDQLKSILAGIQAENDTLAAYIEEH